MPYKAYKLPAARKGRKQQMILIESARWEPTPFRGSKKTLRTLDEELLDERFSNIQTLANVGKPVINWSAKAAAAIEETAVSMQRDLRPLAAVAETIRDALVAANNPAKIEVEFGVELGGHAGIPLVTAGSAKANFKVTLTWENQKAKD